MHRVLAPETLPSYAQRAPDEHVIKARLDALARRLSRIEAVLKSLGLDPDK